MLTCFMQKSKHSVSAMTPPQVQTSKPCTSYLLICLLLPVSPLWRKHQISLTRKQGSLSAVRTHQIYIHFIFPQTEEKYSLLCVNFRWWTGQHSVQIKCNSLDLKLFDILLLHLEMGLFRVAAWPRDLRTKKSAFTHGIVTGMHKSVF